ncbi:MAG: dihydrolipoyl dehydrogenase family protein [Candidatus Dormibacteria bacterium]
MARFDVAVLGGGSGAEAVCGAGLGGRSVVVIEEARFGGECPFLACMPSKAMLHDARGHRDSHPGSWRTPDPVAYRSAAQRRDQVAEHLDDSQHLEELRAQGVTAIRGRGRVVGPGLLQVGEQRVEADDLVIATGSEPVIPDIAGLDQVDYWLSDRVLTSTELPQSAAVLGGGPVGCELAQLLARFGCRTSLIEVAERLLPAEEPELGRALQEQLQEDGVEVLLGSPVLSVTPAGAAGVRLQRRDGPPQDCQILVLAVGRRPRLQNLGLEAYGLDPKVGRLTIDAHCRALGQAHLFGVGDVTGVAPFTHTANYQGRVTAANLRGEAAIADYRAIPRAVYTDPPVAAVGLTRQRAQDQGTSIRSVTLPLRETARALAEGTVRGALVLLADPAQQVLLGAAVAGPGADEGIGWAALAIRAEIRLATLRDTVAPFPTYSEAYQAALDRLQA